MKKSDLLKSREYWISKIQIDLFNLIENYRKSKGITKTELAEELGFTKGYITQVLNGDFDHKVSKLVDLALAFDKVPELKFSDISDVLEIEEKKTHARIIPMTPTITNFTAYKSVNVGSGRFSEKTNKTVQNG